MSKGKEETAKAYSIRKMPESFKDRLREQAAYETRINREGGGDIKTMEALALECMADGLKRREAKRRAAK